MTGKISEDADRSPDGTEKIAAAVGGFNYGILLSTIASWLAARTTTLTNKTISAASNTISNLATSMFAANVIDTDTTLAANSDTRLATQKAVKAYADGLIAANDAMVFKGATDCSANPNYPAANRGDTYRVSVAGKIGGASGVVVEVGDLFICNTDSTASGNQATVGTAWNVIQTNIDGAVVGPASATDKALARYNATTGKLIQTSEITLGDSDGKLTRAAGISIAGTNTNDDAAAGYFGEYGNSNIAVGSAVVLTSGATANVTSISFPPGDYDVWIQPLFTMGATTNVTFLDAQLTTSSATLGTLDGLTTSQVPFGSGQVPGVGAYSIPPVRTRFKFASTTTLYFVAQATFTVSSCKVWGAMQWRRVR